MSAEAATKKIVLDIVFVCVCECVCMFIDSLFYCDFNTNTG